MQTVLLVHILAGMLGLVLGAVALSVTKGARLHRKSGMLFVYAMLTMALCGLVITVVENEAPAINIPAALITIYLVVTALTTVRPPAVGARWVDGGAMLVGLAVGLTCLAFGVEALARGGQREGIPAFPFFLFGVVGLLGSLSDFRRLQAGGLEGTRRLARHLWRMCFALFIAALSFFIGQSDEFPEALRHLVLLALPVLAVLATMVYWLWRVRIRKTVRGIVGVWTDEAV